MTGHEYRTGSWTALVTEDALALLHPAVSEDVARELWQLTSTGTRLGAWVEYLAAAGIAALPSFVMVEAHPEGLRVLVRGDVEVEQAGRVVSGRGYATWREELLPAEDVTVRAETADGSWLPVTGGIVRAGEARLVVGSPAALAPVEDEDDVELTVARMPALAAAVGVRAVGAAPAVATDGARVVPPATTDAPAAASAPRADTFAPPATADAPPAAGARTAASAAPGEPTTAPSAGGDATPAPATDGDTFAPPAQVADAPPAPPAQAADASPAQADDTGARPVGPVGGPGTPGARALADTDPGPDTDDDGAPAPAPADGPAPVVTHVPAGGAPAPAPSDLSAAAEASSTAEGAAPAGADAPSAGTPVAPPGPDGARAGADAPSAGTPAAPPGPDGPQAGADTGAAARAADDAATADPSGAAVPGEESPEDSDDYDFLLWSTEEVQARQTPAAPAPADGDDDGPAPTDADAPAPPRPEPAAETTPAPDLEATRIPEPEPEDGGSPFAPPEGGIMDSVPGRPRPDAPVGAPVDLPPPSGAPAGPVDDGDHDGETLMTSDLPTPSAPLVAEPVVRAEPGVELVLSTGPRIEMDRPVLLGRAPEAARFAGSEVPRLVSVSNPERDISATHVEIRPAGGHVVVTDMNSTNGTVVHLPDQPSFRLQPGTGVPVAAGAVIELGTGVEVTVQPVEGAQ